MSIQVHPDEDYVVSQNNEKGRQDESYYVVQTGQGAKTYLASTKKPTWRNSSGPRVARRRTEPPSPTTAYVNAQPSEPGSQFLIPAGTIHSSGRNRWCWRSGA